MSREGQVMAALMRKNEKREQVRREGHVTATGEFGTNAGHQVACWRAAQPVLEQNYRLPSL